jgi:hypothetical protein
LVSNINHTLISLLKQDGFDHISQAVGADLWKEFFYFLLL